jgi:hypothetical protein
MPSMEELAKSDHSLAGLKTMVDDRWEATDF